MEGANNLLLLPSVSINERTLTMKRLPLILLSACIIFCACEKKEKAKCLAFPQEGLKYLATHNAGMTLTYLALDLSDSMVFDCSYIDADECYTLWVSADTEIRGDCGPQAKQVLSRPFDSIVFITTGYARPNEIAKSFSANIKTYSLFDLKPVISWRPSDGTLIDEDYLCENNDVNQIFLPEWTSAGGTRYTEVYHLLDSETSLYLAPGYGIVQIETLGKTYYLQHENK